MEEGLPTRQWHGIFFVTMAKCDVIFSSSVPLLFHIRFIKVSFECCRLCKISKLPS